MKTNLFDNNDKYTVIASQIDSEFSKGIHEVFEKYRKQYSVRELGIIAYGCVMEEMCSAIMDNDAKR